MTTDDDDELMTQVRARQVAQALNRAGTPAIAEAVPLGAWGGTERGWRVNLLEGFWTCPHCRDIYGPEDEDKPPTCDMCKKAGR